MRHPEPAHTEGMIAVHTSCDAGDFPCRGHPLAVQGPSGIGSQTVDIAMGLVYAHYEHRFFIAESEIVIVDTWLKTFRPVTAKGQYSLPAWQPAR